MKEDIYILILMMITVPLAGELKFYPFHDTYRISFGIPIFFLCLLWIRKIPEVLAGFLVGACVIGFRMALDWSILANFHYKSDFIIHISAFIYYITYSYLFYLTKINRLHNRLFLVGLLAVFIEITSSIVELTVRHYTLGDIVNLFILNQVVIIAVIRSFFALSFFTIIKLNQTRSIAQHQQEQNRHMLLLISGLYEESINLKKSIQYAEDITRDCYNLYEKLHSDCRPIELNEDASSENVDSKRFNHCYPIELEELSKKILGIAGQVHEIKKDNQRIFAGVSKMISDENSTDYMDISELGKIIVQSNKKYALSLEKDIKFTLNIEGSFSPLHAYTVLSLINNLVSNAVESIEETGFIKIFIIKIEDEIKIQVSDNGLGIPKKKRELIFKPGYTTKYDLSGRPSTGMGLSYVKDVINNLNGSISIQEEFEKNETVFIINLPINSLVKKG